MALVMILCLSSCGNGGENSRPGEDDDRLVIVATVFPEYDWAKAILGDNPADAELILLTDKGTDLHSFQPSAEDILNITTCDILIYAGGESDGFIDDALETKENEGMIRVNLLEILGDMAKEEEDVEGMQPERGGEEDEEEAEYDEHVWLSLRNAEILCTSLCDAISDADPQNKEYYRSNLKNYLSELEELDREFTEAVSEGDTDYLLFADRFPFRYFVDDYGLKYYAAFAGCSADAEASFETITFLKDKVDELGLRSVIVIENSDGRLADTIIKNTETKDQKILVLNSMQSVSGNDIEEGASYLRIMEENLAVLKEALKID